MTLPHALAAINWHSNVSSIYADGAVLEPVESALLRSATWSMQLELADKHNPALCFIREMQSSLQQGAALIGLALYKPSAAAARTAVETCIYYSYYRTHGEELATLVRSPRWYLSKSQILEYHQLHTPGWSQAQAIFGFTSGFEHWYSQVSAVIHGQIPGSWNNHAALSDVAPVPATTVLAVEALVAAERYCHELLLCTVASRLWDSFAPGSKSQLLKGLAGDKRQTLKLSLK